MNEAIIKRFWSRVSIKSPDECWEWIGSRRDYRYGSFHMNKKSHSANRVAWEITNGKIPDGIKVLHKCDNPPCCNPHHLFLGTMANNSEDMMQKGRHHKNFRKTHCIKGHAMTEKNTATQKVTSKYAVLCSNYTLHPADNSRNADILTAWKTAQPYPA